MTSIERILDKGSCYTRFRVAIRVVQEALTTAPSALSTGQLAHVTGYSTRRLGRVCVGLEQAGILTRAPGTRDGWLPGPLPEVTLADILCSQIGVRANRQDKALPERAGAQVAHRDTEAFVLQATININQTVIEQLRRFPLRKSTGALSGGRDA
jgi:hypothetical protein